MNNRDKFAYTGQPEYFTNFWKFLKQKTYNHYVLDEMYENGASMLPLPNGNDVLFRKLAAKDNLFRTYGTFVKAYDGDASIQTKVCDDISTWVAENGAIPIYDGIDDFKQFLLKNHKLATFVKFDTNLMNDTTFDFENYLTNRLAENFALAEEKAFIDGDGIDSPVGILADNGGAEKGCETAELTYDDIIKLYFSLKSKYRKNAVWLMNDKIAYTLRTLKDNSGNYLWNTTDNTILGKKVLISEYMPDAEHGKKPIAFGDLRYYWIVERKPVSVRALLDAFVENAQIGFLAYEFMDGRLIRTDAVKVLQVANTASEE